MISYGSYHHITIQPTNQPVVLLEGHLQGHRLRGAPQRQVTSAALGFAARGQDHGEGLGPGRDPNQRFIQRFSIYKPYIPKKKYLCIYIYIYV